jgi:1-acyl-sn-glycerol-3-phosphate acyltransferase
MTRLARRAATALSTTLLPTTALERILRTRFRDAGHGYDAFGLDPHSIAATVGVVRLIYRNYFRVRSYGAQNIPAQGSAILAANHSGTLPFDGAMLYTDILEHTDPPRIPRVLADFFVTLLPFIGTWFSRVGIVNGARRNLRHLLRHGELIMVFPEGTPGIGKPFRDRYQLQKWRVGHAELAIRYGVPVVPVALIGAEEQWPLFTRIEGFRMFGAPYLPIPMVPFPLPVRYHIHYGAPIHFDLPPESADDPDAVDDAALQVKAAVQALIDDGLRQRKGVFR